MQDNGRNYFTFYDNYTADVRFGASSLNRVYYDPASGSLTGIFVGVPNQGIAPIAYKVSQIRKSFK